METLYFLSIYLCTILQVQSAAAQVIHYNQAIEQTIQSPQIQMPTEPVISEAANAANDLSRERIVLLHGMGHGSLTMKNLAKAFETLGYKVSNLNLDLEHDVLRKVIEEAYDDISRFIERDKDTIHFVCYSQGCLVVRGIIEQHRPAYLGRVVMLGPPNQGGEYVDYLRQHQIATFVNKGLNLPNLGTTNRRTLARLIGTSAEGYDLGIIAGQEPRSNLPITVTVPGANRTILGQERTQLDGMKEFVTVQTHHDDLYKDQAVQALAIQFIQTGTFVKDDRNDKPAAANPAQ